ncbi:hypothetical protein H4219_004807 [Mycoemilia scoparia]|uniref:SAM domain-containing protein n=1 Tax=Mycoemilia scoparia TaxID=417184 RepID=A0A9W7ZYI6_9FUNG|nr:hypothetical protein H4219_004807 [Mycoemilia scoparia]
MSTPKVESAPGRPASSRGQESPSPQNSADPVWWSVDEVCAWIESQPSISDLSAVVRSHAIDGHVLTTYITNSVLVDELGISAYGKRVRLLEAIEGLKWSSGISSSSMPKDTVQNHHQREPSIHNQRSANGNEEATEHMAHYNHHQRHNSQHYGSDYNGSVSSLHEPTAAKNHPYSRYSSSPGIEDSNGTSISSVRSLSPAESNNGATAFQTTHKRGRPNDSSQKEESANGNTLSKRSASRIADAEKKRQKRAELKKDPEAYAEYLQKERERNARRRARLREEKARKAGLDVSKTRANSQEQQKPPHPTQQQQHPEPSSFPKLPPASSLAPDTPVSSASTVTSSLGGNASNLSYSPRSSNITLPSIQSSVPGPHHLSPPTTDFPLGSHTSVHHHRQGSLVSDPNRLPPPDALTSNICNRSPSSGPYLASQHYSAQSTGPYLLPPSHASEPNTAAAQ